MVAWLAIIALAACGGSPTAPDDDDDDAGFNNTTTFRGTIAGSDGRTGVIEITIQTVISSGAASSSVLALHAPDEVSGSLTVSGQGVSLTGEYEHSNGRVTLSGAGYTFQGFVGQDGILEGTYEVAGQPGGFSMINSSRAFVTAYCGSFTGNEPDDRGVWNVQLPSSGGQMSGVAVQDGSNDNGPPTSPGDPDIIYIHGSVNGQVIDFTLFVNGIGVGSGAGSLVGQQTVSGIWSDNSGDSGTFSGSTAGCQ